MNKKEYKKEYYQKNKERLKAKAKKWYQENLDKTKVQRKEYRKKNKETIKTRKKEYYEENKDKIRARREKYRNNIMQNFLSKYKMGKCCASCGYKEYPEILQFHHKNIKEKSFNISTFRKTSQSSLLKKEIDKCILLCPNCHNWLHFKETKEQI